MRKYLVVFEAPCVGLNEELVTMESDKQVSDWAWERSLEVREYVDGSYDIFRLSYDNHLVPQLTPVNEVEIWEAEA